MTEMTFSDNGRTSSFLVAIGLVHNLLAANRRRRLPFVGNWAGLPAAIRPSYFSRRAVASRPRDGAW